MAITQMLQDEYDRLKASSHGGTALCPTCKTYTPFVRDDYGVIFCVSCGNEPEVAESE